MPVVIQGQVLYEGAVLDKRERNYYDDSDFYAIVWDEAEQRIKDIEYASTRFWSYGDYAVIDATPEVIAKASAYLRQVARQKWDEWNRQQAEKVKPGKEVEVVRGRKVPIGTVGVVGWIGPDRFKTTRYRTYYRVRIDLPDGTSVFTAEENVKVRNPETYLRPPEEGDAYAERMVRNRCWVLAVNAHGLLVL